MTISVDLLGAPDTAPIGVSVGMEILGTPWTEGESLRIAQRMNDLLDARRTPVTGGIDERNEVMRPYAAVWSVHVITPRGVAKIDTRAYLFGIVETWDSSGS